MPYVYRHFIPQNTAPSGAKKIGVYDSNGNRVLTIPLGGLTPPTGTKLYSFGLFSDIHTYKSATNWDGNGKFDRGLSYLESYGCAMCIISGDLTQTGLYDEASGGGYVLNEAQFAKYKEICDKHSIPVYELCGNHESYYGQPITNNMDKLQTYTGKNVLSYTVVQGNDLFILCGQPRDTTVMTDEDFIWLGTTLEANKDKRCFVFVHSHIDDNVEGGVEDSGNPAFARENSIFGYWGATKTANFISLMQQYPNAILFHGHTHIKFEAQEFDKDANFSTENGFKSVHVPSLGSPRTLISADGTWQGDDAGSQGYIVDVYADCIVLNGWDFVNNQYVPLGVYKIAT
jgi:3',5'-cyclic AMP phosphodiesterase CpdA